MEVHQRGIQEMSFSNSSPRPVPFILPDTPFSQRKKTPLRARFLPSSPAKSCPPVSRLFTPKQQKLPQLVSFKSEGKAAGTGVEIVLISMHYTPACAQNSLARTTMPNPLSPFLSNVLKSLKNLDKAHLERCIKCVAGMMENCMQ